MRYLQSSNSQTESKTVVPRAEKAGGTELFNECRDSLWECGKNILELVGGDCTTMWMKWMSLNCTPKAGQEVKLYVLYILPLYREEN